MADKYTYITFCGRCGANNITSCHCREATAYQEGNLCQCQSVSPTADVLLDNFRNDVTCRALQTYKDKGLSLVDLLNLQKKLPIIYPWDKNYDNLRYNVNRRFVSFPLGIVMAQTTHDVVETINFVRNYKLHLVARSGSHCFENFSLTDGIILDQSQRTTMRVCVDKKIAHFELGCLIGPVQKILSEVGLIFVGGTCPNNSISLTLGGGIGFLIRQYGLSSDSLLEAEIVLANGDLIRSNHKDYPDLFWALQGAGNGNFGVVTQLTIRLHRPCRKQGTIFDCTPKFIVFDIKYEYSKIHQVIDIWQRWAPRVTKRLGTEVDIYKDYILLTGQYIGCDVERVKNLLSPLLQLQPFLSDYRIVNVADATRYHGGIGYWLPFFKNKSTFVEKYLSPAAIDIIEEYMRKDIVGSEDHVEMNAFGGLMDNISQETSAFPWRNSLFWMHLQCHWLRQEQGRDKIKWVTSFYNKIKQYTTGAYFNAPDVDLQPNYMQEYFSINAPRLIEIKKRYDPTNFFRYQQSIPVFE